VGPTQKKKKKKKKKNCITKVAVKGIKEVRGTPMEGEGKSLEGSERAARRKLPQPPEGEKNRTGNARSACFKKKGEATSGSVGRSIKSGGRRSQERKLKKKKRREGGVKIGKPAD